MSGKRKRGRDTFAEDPIEKPVPSAKPISAIAAARLQLEAKLQAQNAPIKDVGALESATSPMVEATSDFSESELEEDDLVPLVHQNFKLCSWRRISENILSDTESELAIILEKHQTISFVGCFDLKVLKGAVNVNGANIGAVPRAKDTAKEYRVYVPSTHPITKIRGLDRTSHVQFVSCQEPTLLESTGPLFAGIWATPKDKGRSFEYIQESDADPLKRALAPEIAPEEWIRNIEDISSASSVSIVIGSSLCGKSTFAKRLLNRYLTGFGKTAKAVPSVCYLDLDPSKPEYTPHGQVSLTNVREVNLGPAFTHPISNPGGTGKNETVAAHALPMQELANYEDYFKSCVSDLFQAYRAMRSKNINLPLIINTPADLYSMHFPLLESLLTNLKPGNIIHLGNTSAIDIEAAEKLHSLSTISAKQGSTLFELPAQPPLLPPSRTDAELRAMHMQSYFHLSPPATSWTPQPLSTTTPWQFTYEETQTRTQDIHSVLLLNDPPAPSQLATMLNGSIVHIIRTTNPPSLQQSPQNGKNAIDTNGLVPRTAKYRIPYIPANQTSHAPLTPHPQSTRLLCTALIHSFDPASRVVNLLVPTTHDALLHEIDPSGGTATVLVGGCCDLPEWAYVEDAHVALADGKRRVSEAVGGSGLSRGEEDVAMDGVSVGPWVERKSVVDGMGYFGTVRRVRKFLG
ncbi:unnamed protein product [Periconia digitata]|uniref:Polynucleotide 5'-hydroxyl-kinase GRC3 n=1 Tax=Periconia digitata TaxID=1303443 RepID=A0A9W4XPJ9_9PLEO|nr:unnamed protein product [Periconia digitata]